MRCCKAPLTPDTGRFAFLQTSFNWALIKVFALAFTVFTSCGSIAPFEVMVCGGQAHYLSMQVTSTHSLPYLATRPQVGVEETFVRDAESWRFGNLSIDLRAISCGHTRVMCEWSELFTIMHAFVQRHTLLNEVKLGCKFRYCGLTSPELKK